MEWEPINERLTKARFNSKYCKLVQILLVMSRVVVQSVYKPPNDQFAVPTLGHRDLLHIVIGYFNSHSTSWGYNTADNNGEAVEQWADSCDLTLIHDAKLPKLFNSARWKK